MVVYNFVQFEDQEIVEPDMMMGQSYFRQQNHIRSPEQDGVAPDDGNSMMQRNPDPAMNKSTIGKHFLSGSQNPFMAFTNGVVKIAELLEEREKAVKNN